ncbi:MAG: hypothetical protein ACR2OV_14160, partial [Hyphomicrobiaceae bacterium]
FMMPRCGRTERNSRTHRLLQRDTLTSLLSNWGSKGGSAGISDPFVRRPQLCAETGVVVLW